MDLEGSQHGKKVACLLRHHDHPPLGEHSQLSPPWTWNQDPSWGGVAKEEPIQTIERTWHS